MSVPSQAEDVVAKCINYGGIISAQRVHAVALAATGEARPARNSHLGLYGTNS